MCRFNCSGFIGIQLELSKTVDIKTDCDMASITLEPVHKENEGVYTAQLKTRDGTKEHSAFVYVKGECNMFTGVI